jgi:hypothetical protein
MRKNVTTQLLAWVQKLPTLQISKELSQIRQNLIDFERKNV